MSPPLDRQSVSQVCTKVETLSSKEIDVESCTENLSSIPMDSPKLWSRAQKRVERREEVLLDAAVELSDAVGALRVVLAVAVELSAVGGAVTVAFPGRLREGSVVVELSAGGAATGISEAEGSEEEVDAEGGSAAHAAGAVVRLIDIRR